LGQRDHHDCQTTAERGDDAPRDFLSMR